MAQSVTGPDGSQLNLYSNQEQFSFFSLPRELRDKIYGYCALLILSNDDNATWGPSEVWDLDFSKANQLAEPIPHILLVNKKMHVEARAILAQYFRMDFDHIRCNWDDTIYARVRERLLTAGVYQPSEIRFLIVNWRLAASFPRSISYMDNLFNAAANLREVEIDWRRPGGIYPGSGRRDHAAGFSAVLKKARNLKVLRYSGQPPPAWERVFDPTFKDDAGNTPQYEIQKLD
ncbi:hypothetical protein BJ170DRAFT_678714 [Xylariales sp. AK1849]|nr:hypothetical protein BJ170DRAFT_678714 [Xylariales sp. AK1849]